MRSASRLSSDLRPLSVKFQLDDIFGAGRAVSCLRNRSASKRTFRSCRCALHHAGIGLSDLPNTGTDPPISLQTLIRRSFRAMRLYYHYEGTAALATHLTISPSPPERVCCRRTATGGRAVPAQPFARCLATEPISSVTIYPSRSGCATGTAVALAASRPCVFSEYLHGRELFAEFNLGNGRAH